MCLYTKWILPRKTKRDILVYKVVAVDSYGNMYTPFMKNTYYLQTPYSAEGPKTRTMDSCFMRRNPKTRLGRITYSKYFDNDIEVYRIDKGYIHCCKTLEAAKKWRNSTLSRFYPYVIIKCLVHSDTLYFESALDDGILCVRSLVTLEIVYDEINLSKQQ